jgi:hypothetical protein
MKMTEIILTPSEDLMIEALIARARLGETLWTFDSRHKATAEKLEAKGLVHWKHGVVDKTIMVFLTSKSKKEWLSHKYVPPLVDGLKKAQKRSKQIVKNAKRGL